MTTCQTITIDFEDEMKNTRKLLERVPLDDAHRGYKPHDKSMPLERLATHVAELPSWPKMALASELFELKPGFKPHIAASTAELLDVFDKSVHGGSHQSDPQFPQPPGPPPGAVGGLPAAEWNRHPRHVWSFR